MSSLERKFKKNERYDHKNVILKFFIELQGLLIVNLLFQTEVFCFMQVISAI